MELVNAVYYRHTHKCSFVSQLLLLLFIDHQSILYREERNKGLGLFYGIKEEIFGDFCFIVSLYQPLNIWEFIDNNLIDCVEIKKYFEILNLSLVAYMKENRDIAPEVFFYPLRHISEIVRDNTYILTKNIPYNYLPARKNLMECFIGVTMFILTIMKYSNIFYAEDKVSIKKNKFNFLDEDKTLYGAIALGIYEIIESASTHEDNNEHIRLLLLEIYSASESISLVKLQSRLDRLIKRKIIDNILAQYFPPVTRAIIYSFGLGEPNKSKTPLCKFLMKILKKYFIKSYNRNSIIATSMLPQDTIFDSSLKKLSRKVEYGIGRSREEVLLLT